MIITFTGAQSTGKTTLLDICEREYVGKYSIAREITRTLAKEGFPINEAGGNVTQLLIGSSHIKNAFKKDIILDRCALDGLVYTKWLNMTGKVDYWVVEYSENLLKELLPKYDIIFYTDPADVILVDDGVRSTNIQFRNDIIKLFEFYIKQYKINVIKLSGDVTQRMETIKKYIK